MNETEGKKAFCFFVINTLFTPSLLTLSIIYNLLSWTTVFAVCSYAFELVADIVALIKDSLWTGHKEKENNKHKE